VDPLARFSPAPATPPGERCACTGGRPLKLMSALGANPFFCMACTREVDPASLGLADAVLEQVAVWRSVFDAIDRLWLDSSAYEGWAEGELSRLTSDVNVRGRAARAAVAGTVDCYYWLFRAPDRPLGACPGCGGAWTAFAATGNPHLLCEHCKLVTARD
jgi:hypothetical protein